MGKEMAQGNSEISLVFRSQSNPSDKPAVSRNRKLNSLCSFRSNAGFQPALTSAAHQTDFLYCIEYSYGGAKDTLMGGAPRKCFFVAFTASIPVLSLHIFLHYICWKYALVLYSYYG